MVGRVSVLFSSGLRVVRLVVVSEVISVVG